MEQEEELESLSYVYLEDELTILSDRSPVHIQVRVQSTPESTHTPIKSLLDLQWGENYPHEKPTIQIISMDIPEEEKKRLQESLLAACEDCMGMAMTYVLSSTLGSLLTDWHEDSLAKVKAGSSVTAEVAEETVVDTSSLKSTSSEVKTKAQKRREQNGWEKVGERPRGWNWVDVMSHLRKTANTDCYVCFIRNGDVSHYIINDVFISIKSKVISNYNAIRTEYYGSILEYNTLLASIKVL